MTSFNDFRRSATALFAAVLIGFTFIAAATGPALVTSPANIDIIA